MVHLHRFFAAGDHAQQTFLDAQARLFEVGLARAVAGAQIQPFAAFVKHHQRAHARVHEFARFARDDAQRFIEIQRGIDRAAHTGEGFEQVHFQPQLFIKPGVLNHLGRLHGEFLEQFLVIRAEGVRAVRIHVQNAARFAVHFQRHGQFRAHAAPRGDVARVFGHVAERARVCRGARPSR